MSEDQIYIERCLNGDQNAFAFLVNKYQQKLYGVAFRMIANREDALDLTQEALLKAYDALPQYDERYAFSTWIYRIITNLSINFIRKKKVDFRLLDQDKTITETNFEQEEFRQALYHSLIQLSPRERAAFTLANFEKIPVAKIADVLEIPKGTVCWLLFQARKKLQNLMKDWKE